MLKTLSSHTQHRLDSVTPGAGVQTKKLPGCGLSKQDAGPADAVDDL